MPLIVFGKLKISEELRIHSENILRRKNKIDRCVDKARPVKKIHKAGRSSA